MRIQKYIAMHTEFSRRAAEEMIQEKKVRYNKKDATIGQVVKNSDLIEIEGQVLKVNLSEQEQAQVLIMNKPLGIICSAVDDKNRKTIYDLLPKGDGQKWVMVGRLDVNTSGLILFTTSGDLANQLMHPSSELSRIYHVRVFGEDHQAAAMKLKKTVVIDGEKMSFKRCEMLKGVGDKINTWYEVEVKTGQYRMIRRMWEHQGLKVSRLVRVGYGRIKLPRGLRIGETRMLTEKEVSALVGEIKGKCK